MTTCREADCESSRVAREILDQCNSMSIATCTDKEPWAASVFFVADEASNLYFISSESSRHSRNIAKNARAAATINKDHSDWFTITGLQIEGRVSVTPEVEHERVLALYLSKFRGLLQALNTPGDEQERTIANRLMASTFYRLKPASIRLIDNRKGFGFKADIDIAQTRDT